jgi:hypothetical protein
MNFQGGLSRTSDLTYGSGKYSRCIWVPFYEKDAPAEQDLTQWAVRIDAQIGSLPGSEGDGHEGPAGFQMSDDLVRFMLEPHLSENCVDDSMVASFGPWGNECV